MSSSLLVVQIPQIEVRERVFRIGFERARIPGRGFLHFPHAKRDGAEIHQSARRIGVGFDRFAVRRDRFFDRRAGFFERESALKPVLGDLFLSPPLLARGRFGLHGKRSQLLDFVRIEVEAAAGR